MTTHIDIPDGKTRHICIDCQVAAIPELTRLEDANRMIEEMTLLRESYERLVSRCGGMDAPFPTGFESIAAIAWTPQKALQAVNVLLRNTEQDRANILDAMPEAERLKVTLAEAIKHENYEEAARLKQQLDSLPAPKKHQ
ncbi:MAG: UvrB/UvrC motif-containing protein [Opitutaceae bacterium]|nr:UvrB/UvrC motif-containing protein [Opitutaceae bacterium]